MIATQNFAGVWNGVRKTASANTLIVQVIPPFPGASNSPPIQYGPSIPGNYGTVASTANQLGYQGNWLTPGGYTHITDLIYTSLSTAHSLYCLRPQNYVYQVSDMTSSSTTMALSADPGTWATAGVWKYGNGVTVPSQANNTIAASDYVAYQLNDGRWVADLVASGSGVAPVLTTGIPGVTGTKLLAGSPVFFFGAVGDTDPNTGNIQPLMDSVANTRLVLSAYGPGIWNSVHKGDPLIVISSNGTDAGIIEVLAGYYSIQG